MLKILLLILIVLAVVYLFFVFLSRKTYPVEYGISFSDEYAEFLGLNAQEVYTAMLTELKPKHIRIAATWKNVEPRKNDYHFDDVDWFMDKAAKAGTKVVLVVGQKAPRWPECHVPHWLKAEQEIAKEQLLKYVRETVMRYKDHSALEFWQVENEPFIHFTFGECEGYIDDAIYEEIQLVKSLDTAHPIIVTDSGELGFWYKAANAGDYFGTTLYRVVRTPSGLVFTYDWLPAAFYRLKARVLGVDLQKFFVSELQGEPWFSSGNPTDTAVAVQEETMNPARLKKHIEYTSHIGVSRAYLWGVEWWYYMAEKQGDPRYVELIRGLSTQIFDTPRDEE